MSRYTGPAYKKSRRVSFSTLENGKDLAKRSYRPGQHGQDRKAKPSNYAEQLNEKQKVKFTYGMTEKQFHQLFTKAGKMDGIHVENVVKKITYDLVVMSIIVCVCALVIALIIPLYRLYKMFPAELLATSDRLFVTKENTRKKKTVRLRGSWIGLLNNRIHLYPDSTILIMVIVLSSALFGYVFFRAFSNQATVEERGARQMMGLDGDGYVVVRSPNLRDLGNNVSNRHDAGIIPSFPESVENNPNVEKAWSVIMNESTRLVFAEEPEEGLKKLLGDRSLNYRSSDDPRINEGKVAEASIFKHMGYDSPVYMYELPTVGLTKNEMSALNGDVLSGEISIDKIKSGEEVVLAVPEDLKEFCQQYYPVGSKILFDDILLTEEEELLDDKDRLEEQLSVRFIWVILLLVLNAVLKQKSERL